ncbi:MAG TPA: CBS domain-containing protein [Candidatus Dormibacteraeota bacterium]|nr:CBS domain-containing protein [Candidatus Dormibacteraeota bacterium]
MAAARMRAVRVGALAVVAGGRLVGFLTERDLLRAVADGMSTDVAAVSDYMRPVPGAIGPGATASAAAARMIELGARHLPVVSAGRLAGVVSATDLLCLWGVPAALLGDEPL